MYKQILIVDDDICLAYAIQLYLSSPERKTFIVNNPKSALQLLKFYQFDLVISDILMPTMDGYEFLTKLRKDLSLVNIPVIFLTAKGMTADRIKGYDLGCRAYLTKPFHPSELLSIINNIFNDLNLLKSSNQRSIVEDLKMDQVSSLEIDLSHFTSREISILRLLVKGMMNKEIASYLNLSIRNVEKYVGRLLSKTQTRNRTELAQLSYPLLIRANDGTRTRE